LHDEQTHVCQLEPKAMISIQIESPTTPEAAELLERSEALSVALYPPVSRHIASAEILSDDGVRFFVARSDGAAVGCGALVLEDGYGEIKRMFVDASMRGKGVGHAVLEALEGYARSVGFQVLRLETGVHNREAVALYARNGYERGGPFGPYLPDPLSIFMEKWLINRSGGSG